MKPVVVRRIARAEGETIRLLGDLGVATVSEAQGRTGLMRPYMRPIYSSARVSGSAVTVWCQPGDNLMIHAAMEVVGAGDVLVVGQLHGRSGGGASSAGQLHASRDIRGTGLASPFAAALQGRKLGVRP